LSAEHKGGRAGELHLSETEERERDTAEKKGEWPAALREEIDISNPYGRKHTGEGESQKKKKWRLQYLLISIR